MGDGFINFNLNEKTPTIIRLSVLAEVVEMLWVGILTIRGFDVDFIICNTDYQALQNSPIPCRVQLGKELTSGHGACRILSWGNQLRRIWLILKLY
ncbi:MAG: hypothetical protein V8S95_09290 [Odoribacter sp.]